MSAQGAAHTCVLLALVALGAGLRAWQYAADTSLWLDEVALARGIVDLDLASLLTRPLPYDQIAPRGFLLVEKLAVRGLGGTHHQRAKRSAVVGLLIVLEIPLVHWSVRLWRSLHQEASVLDTDGDIDLDGLMLFSLFVGVIAFTLLYVWLVLHRSRTMAMEDLLEDQGLDEALAARRAEAVGA